VKAAAPVPLTPPEDEDVVELALAAIGLRLDGKAAAATVARRKRAAFYNVLDMAATGKRRVLARNPLDTMRRKPPEVAEKVDRRVVVNPRQAAELLTGLSYVGGRDRDRGRRLVAMFACMYYAALRPAEAVNLRKADCVLRSPAGAGCTWHGRHRRSASATPIAASCTTTRGSSTGPMTRSGPCRSRPSWWRSCAGTSQSSA
jgi:integrase